MPIDIGFTICGEQLDFFILGSTQTTQIGNKHNNNIEYEDSYIIYIDFSTH